MRPSGPGAPVELSTQWVETNALRLAWAPAKVDPSRGVWHGSGGLPMLGFRVYLRVASRRDAPDAPSQLVGSTAATELTVEGLPPQTLFSLFVVGENTQHAGLKSKQLLVATRGLRATLFSECGHATDIYTPVKYQGCFTSRNIITQDEALTIDTKTYVKFKVSCKCLWG